MDITRLSEGEQELLRHMELVGYSDSYVSKVRGTVRWLRENHDSFASYEEAVDVRAPEGTSAKHRRDLASLIGICRDFDLEGSLPEFGRVPKAPACTSYQMLAPGFAGLVDMIRDDERLRGLSEKSVRCDASTASNFLLAMQGLGRASLAEVTEDDLIGWSRGRGDPGGDGRRVRRLLSLDLGEASGEARRVASLVPTPPVGRAVVDFLRPDEVEAIREELRDEGSVVSLRDRAIVATLFYTGLRASDVAGLRLADVDWDDDEIRVTQAKTGLPLVLPLPARVGNAIWGYLGEARPESDDDHVFLSARRPHGPVSTQGVDRAVYKVMDAAGVRVGDGRRRGSHLFRHNVATTIVGSGMRPEVAGATLGHGSPRTIDRYLHADVEHLRACALDVSAFGLGKGAFDV